MGVIQCGAFTGNTTVTLGWEPQFIMFKRTDAAGDWIMIDSSRGCSVGSVDAILNANLANAESSSDYIDFTATGFITKGLTGNYIYTVIRRPNKPPTLGTQVYNAIARTGTGAAANIIIGFPADLNICLSDKDAPGSFTGSFLSRLRGDAKAVYSQYNLAEQTFTDGRRVFTGPQSGVAVIGTQLGNISSRSNCEIFIRRAPGFHSEICYTGNGSNRTEAHDLGKIPDLVLVKSRSSAQDWCVWCTGLSGTEKLVLNSPAAKVTDTTAWNSTQPTSSIISIGTASSTNTSSTTYAAYLFSNIAGIQSIGTYVGDGTSGRLINCGFTTGSRYVCIKAISTAGNWLTSNTATGITSGNDPYLVLNTSAAEVTTEDWLDPSSGGFLVNQVSASNANVNGVTYMYWSIA